MKRKNRLIGDKAFYRMVLGVAVPIMIQNGITNFVSLLDNIMVGRIGTEQMSGIAIVNQLLTVFNLAVFGAVSGAGIFGAQFYGCKNHKGVQQTFRFKLYICAGILLLGISVLLFGGEELIWLYLHGEGNEAALEATLGYGRQYLLVMLAGLSLVKDMGLALGLVAAMVIAADLLFCAGEGRRWPVRLGRAAGWFGVLGAVVAAGWLGWSVYVAKVSGQDRFDLGNAGDTESLGMAQMMIQGVKELLGIGRTEEFSAMGSAMTDAFFHRQVCLLGSGLVASALVLAVLAAAFVLGDRLHRRRVAVYTLFSLCGFAAFWVFHWFLYLYVFKAMEGQELKDYSRYFLGWYMGWMLGALGLLGTAGGQRKRPWAGLCAGGLFCLLGAVILWRGQTVNNFTTYSATFYDERLQVKERAAAVNAVLEESDRVYPICQGNDGTRWYYYGYELDCELVQMYGGGYGTEADPYQPTTAVTLTDETTLGDRQYEVVADAEGLLGYLKACGATVLLVDRSDPWLAGLLQPYTQGQMENSALDAPALYRISWQGDELVFTGIPLENTLLGAWASRNDAAASAGGSEVAAP